MTEQEANKSNNPNRENNPNGKDIDTENANPQEVENDDNAGGVTSPDGVLNLIIAGIFDGVGFIPVVNIVSDIIAVLYFTIWMIGTSKRGWWKLILSFILMLIPVVSDFAVVIGLITFILGIKFPVSWIGFVYSVVAKQGIIAGAKTP